MNDHPPLKPCPFCRGMAGTFYVGDHMYSVECGTCTAEVQAATEEDAVRIWNCRAPIEITDAAVRRALGVWFGEPMRIPDNKKIPYGARHMREAREMIAAALDQRVDA